VTPQCVILAAGKGTRMKSSRPKVLHEILGRPLLEVGIGLAEQLGCSPIVVVVGHGAEAVRGRFDGRVDFAVQNPPLGTGHALMAARDRFAAHPDRPLLVLGGDMPLLRSTTLARLLAEHGARAAALTLLTGILEEPGAYGRVLRGPDGGVAAVVEAKDATPEQRALPEINAGVYVFDVARLLPALASLGADNAQGEYYLTDAVAALAGSGAAVRAVVTETPDEVLGVNSQAERAAATRLLRRRILDELMAAGVAVEDPDSTWVGPEVRVAPDAVIRPFTCLEGRTVVEAGAEIGPGSRLRDVHVAEGARVLDYCVLLECSVGPGAQVGPFSHVRPGSRLGARSRVGNFVELKKTDLGEGSKASHLSYLGDSQIGREVNIGAGTITCNYDGEAKHQTRIGDGAFIGSDSVLVAPVNIGPGAYVAAASAITEDVEAGSLALARARQVVKPGWVRRREQKRGSG